MEPLLNVRDNVRIRLFQESDGDRTREIYLEAMLYGRGSPGSLALQAQLRRPLSFVFYAVFLIGLVLLRRPRTRAYGAAISFVTLVIFIGWRHNTWTKFQQYCMSAVTGDMADIGKQYGTPPSAFWIAEIAAGSQAGTIIGCVGLDSSTDPDPTVAELRRMVVLPDYQGRGVGTLLMNTLIAHAREQGLSAISLSTSMYQTVAMGMYEHLGFVEQKRIQVRVRYLFIISKAYLVFYKLAL